MKLEFSRQIFEISSNIKFHENPSSGGRVVPCGRTDMTKLIAAFRNSAMRLKKNNHLMVGMKMTSVCSDPQHHNSTKCGHTVQVFSVKLGTMVKSALYTHETPFDMTHISQQRV